jgi:hypothetical protein
MPQSLYPLLLLGCPIGTGLMMWVMLRGGTRPSRRGDSPSAQIELAELRAAAQKDTRQPLRN